jgi:hypothetical protein
MTSECVACLFKDFECEKEMEYSPVDVVSPFEKLDSSYEGFQTGRVPLKVTGRHKKFYEACVRFMLYNLPLSNDDPIEVNFVHLQLAIQMDGCGTIFDVRYLADDSRRYQGRSQRYGKG